MQKRNGDSNISEVIAYLFSLQNPLQSPQPPRETAIRDDKRVDCDAQDNSMRVNKDVPGYHFKSND
jgi:hypothetical protein